MKPIVVLTDFSAPADNAMLYAGNLAQKLGCSLLLLHIYQVPVSMNEVPVIVISAEELKSGVDAGLYRSRAALQRAFPDLTIKTESRLGDLISELEDVCRETGPLLIVEGKHDAGGLERILFGSTALSVVRHAHIPVIVVPAAAPGKEIKRLGLAIGSEGPGQSASFIGSMTQALQASLHIVHVHADGTSPELSFSQLPDASFHTVRDEDFLNGIQTFLEEQSIDLLAVLPHRHSLIERLFFRIHTEELVNKLSIPVMCINQS
ncbi:MAG TPA: universal stress protein [Flavisolibacter sp.]|nr:universal stress protein [Flavisolibacter sp.]